MRGVPDAISLAESGATRVTGQVMLAKVKNGHQAQKSLQFYLSSNRVKVESRKSVNRVTDFGKENYFNNFGFPYPFFFFCPLFEI
jgi:polyribonucleotide nucleotidyltransferase